MTVPRDINEQSSVGSIPQTEGDVTIRDDLTVTGEAIGGGITITKSVTFTEQGAGTYTGTIQLPAGARIIDIGVHAQVLWAAATSASMIVGDGATPNGFFTSTDLKATDLLAGEINNIEHPGGKAGAFIASEQRDLYRATARNVVAVATSVGAGTAGRTRVYVTYAVPVDSAAAFVA